MHRRLASLFLRALVPLCASLPVSADLLLGPYAEVQFGGSAVSHSELDFVSPVAGGALGLFVYPGIGIEAFAEGALERGEDGRFGAAVAEAYGAALRFQSPLEGRLHGYVTLGYVDFLLEQESLDQPGRGIEERFTGARFGIGVIQRFTRVPNLAVSAEYRNFYTDEPIQVDGLALGLRIDVR